VAGQSRIAIALHGGAGTIRRQEMTLELDRDYRRTIAEALQAGHAILSTGGTSLEAVEATIVVLEESPLFNAGRGAVLTSAGRAELDACVMEGHTLRAGAVAAVTTIRNPIRAAIAVMNRTPHVLLMGEGAEAFAAEAGLELVENEFFITERRQLALREAQERARKQAAQAHPEGIGYPDTIGGDIEGKYGTVGCVALDRAGNLAAGTSTGGLTNKRFGRVGDTPMIGAGNYAENSTCAASGTGQGEFFMRLTITGDIAARMRYSGESLESAAAAQMRRMGALKGRGGLVAMDRRGVPTFVFNTDGMYRGCIGADGQLHVAIFGDPDDRIPGDQHANGGGSWDDGF
jgi:beta-aspartyl-peptidase (threonine type)